VIPRPPGLSWTQEYRRALFIAVERDDVALLERALKRPNTAIDGVLNDDHRTALMEAAAQRRARIVEALLAHGAQITVQDSRGRTPLRFAVEAQEAAMVERLLVASGQEVIDCADVQQRTPLMEAVARKLPEIAEVRRTAEQCNRLWQVAVLLLMLLLLLIMMSMMRMMVSTMSSMMMSMILRCGWRREGS
jgi:hypothetical protein